MPTLPRKTKWKPYVPRIPDRNGYMPGNNIPPNWFIHTPPATPINTWQPPPASNIIGTGPYIQEWTLSPDEAYQLYIQDASLVESLIDLIVEGVSPIGGPSSVAPYGTPGQMMPEFGLGGPGEGPQWEYHFGARKNADGTLYMPMMFGHGEGGKVMVITGINPKFLNVKPKKRKKPKKAWFFNPTGQ